MTVTSFHWISVCLILVFLSLSSTIHAASKKKRDNFPLWDNLEIRKENRQQAYILNLKEVQAQQEAKIAKDKKDKDYSLEFIKDIYDIIHARQNPSREECKRRRFSAIQMSATSFEGTGSLLKQVMISTAIAMHSNRTLVWGLGLPFPFEVTKELWAGPDNEDILINNEHLNCSQHDITFGPLGCFFEPVSTCSLEDAGPAEVIEFSHNPYNDSARITMAEMRKGIAMYHPPMGLLDYIWSKGKYPDHAKSELIGKQAYLWASAVGAYVFRIKPSLIESFERRFNHMFDPVTSAVADSSSASSYSRIVAPSSADVWGVHIRHGDLRALSNIYSYKEIFDFDDYFEGLVKMTSKNHYTPDKVFIATDSLEADNIEKLFVKFAKSYKPSSGKGTKKKANSDDDLVNEVIKDSRRSGDDDEAEDEDEDEDDEEEDEDDDDDEDEDDEEDEDEDDEDDNDEEKDFPSKNSGNVKKPVASSSSSSSFTTSTDASEIMKKVFYGEKKPVFMTITNDLRYRTEHGSHTVAANGGCFRDENYDKKGMRCALNYEAIVHYQALEEHRSVPRPNRMLRVYLESIEDLYILSRCTALIGQGSSHYSTLAALLIVAGHGTKNLDNRLDYLDKRGIASGVTPTAYLHGMNLLNGTNAMDSAAVKSGAQRWTVHSNHFVSGLPADKAGSFGHKVRLTFDPWSPDNRIHIKDGLPHINDQLFYLEARTWLGSFGKYKPSLPGHCPGPMSTKEANPLVYIAENINLGVEHLQLSHNSQAMQCWSDAMAALAKLPPFTGSGPQVEQQNRHLEDMKSVANGNMQTMRIYRYSEMIVNELKTIKDYYIFSDKYMKQAYDRGIDQSTSVANKNKPLSLEEVNERILTLEKELNDLKKLREKLIVAHEAYMNNNYNMDDKTKLLPDHREL
jgi:hypothetical protein